MHQADIEVEGTKKEPPEKKQYFGQTSRPFKSRYYEHKMAMKNKNSPNSTALSRCIW